MSATIAPTPTRAGEPVTDREPVREAFDAGAVGGEARAVAFELVLDVARNALEARARQSGSGSMTPAQMFEPGEPDAEGRRQAVLRTEAQRDFGPVGGDRFDATSVSARRAGASGPGSGGDSADVGDRPVARGSAAAVRTHTELQGSVETNVREPERASGPTDGDVQAGRTARYQPVHEARSTVRASGQGPAGPVGAVRVAPASPQPVWTKGADGVATKVGQVLGATRTSGVESARALQAAPPAADARPEAQARREPQRAPDAQRSPEGAPSRRAAPGEPTKAFDELIRSLRLHSGAHRSSARMYLNPPELGRVSIDVRLEGDRLQVDVRTEHAAAAKLLHDRVVQLRAALAEHGIIVDRFDVGAGLSERGESLVTGDGTSGDRAEHQTSGSGGSSAGSTDHPAAFDSEPDQSGLEMSVWQVDAERRLDVRI